LILCFVVIILSMLAGDAVVLWQFHLVRAQAEGVNGIDQRLVAVLRVHTTLLAFHDRLDELAQAQDAGRLVKEAGPLRAAVLEETRRARSALSLLPPDFQRDPTIMPTILTIQSALPSQLEAITSLATSGDWGAVRLRLANQVRPLESLTAALAEKVENEAAEEQTQTESSIRQVERRVFLTVPLIVLFTLLMAATLGLAITRSITQPLARLVEGSRALARGDFEHQVAIRGEDELAHLGQVFNDTAGRLAVLYGTLREQADLLNLTHDTIFVADMQGVIKYWNRGAEEQYGWTAEQAVGRDVDDLLKTVFPAPLVKIKAEVTRTGRWEGELGHTKKDGTEVVVASRWSLQRDRQGAPVAILETNNDITERKRAEEALRRLNRELRAISNCNQSLLRATDEQSLLQEICRIVCEEAGYRMAWVAYAEHDEAKSVRPAAWTGTEEAYLTSLGITWADTERGCGPTGTAIRGGKTCCIQDFATDPRLAPWQESALQHDFRSGIALPLKDEHASAFGSLTIYSAQCNAFAPEEIRLLEELAGDLAFGIVTLRSRAARQRAEQEVSLLSFALDSVREAAFLIDDRGRFQYVNDEACRVLGHSRAKLLGLGVADIDPELPAERWSDHWRDLKAQRSLSFESRHRTGDGRTFPVEVSANYFEYGGRAYNLALVRDITERKRAEEKIQQQEMELRQVLDLTPQLVAVFGPGRKRFYANQPALDYFGVTLEEWKSISDRFWFYHPDDRERIARDVYTGPASDIPHDFEARLRRKDGAYRWFLFRDNPLRDAQGGITRWYHSATDIEDRKRAEEERQARVWFLESMDRVNRAIGGTNDLEQMTGDVIEAMLSIFDSDRAFLYYPCDPDAPSFEVFMERTRPEYPGARGVIPMTPETARGFQIVRASSGVVTFGPGCDYPLIIDFAKRFGHKSSIGIALYPKIGKPWVLTMHQCSYPRAWTADERKLLEEIARRLTDSLSSLLMFRSLREGEEALKRSEAYLAESQKLTQVGSWAWAPRTDQMVYCSEEVFRIYGLDPRHGIPTMETLLARVHPEDRAWMRARVLEGARGGAEHVLEYRLLLPDGTVKYIRSLRQTVLNASGEAMEVLGTAMDITERKRAEEALRAQAALLDLTHDTVFVMDMKGVIKYWNRGAEERYGWTAEHALGRVVHDLLKTVFPGPLEEIRAEVSRTGRWEGEILHTKKDGTQVVVASRWALQRDERGAPMAILETNNDITLRKRAEEALRLSNAYNRSLIEASPDPLVTIGPDGQITDVNAATEAATGRSRGELVGTDFCDYFTEPAKARAGYEQVFREGMVRDYPLELLHRDGGVMSVLYNASVYRDESGRVIGVFAAARDITKRKRAEEALRLSNAYNRSLIEASLDPLVTIGPDGQITDVNAATEAATGRSRGELVGTDFCDYFTEPAKARAGYEQVFREGMVRDYPLELRCRDGGVMSVLYNASVYRDESGRVIGVFAAARDITERQRAQEALRRSEAYLAEAQRLSHTGSWAFDLASNKYIYASEECFRIFELDAQERFPNREVISRHIHPEDWDRVNESFEKSLRERVDTSIEFKIVLPSGTVKHILAIRHPVLNDAGDIVELVGSAIDMTEHKRAEEERERLHQLEADLARINRVSMMGELAASIAHEVNQPLSGVVVNGNACLRWLAGDSPNLDEAREAVRRIVRDGKRAGDVIARIRALATKTAAAKERLDMNEAIGEVVAFAGDELRKNSVAVRTEFAPDLLPVVGDRVQLQQVVLNLVMNGIEAMSGVEERPRELIIRTQNDDADQVRVAIQDSGIGLDPQSMERIFDAFYTTKRGGMGMGLSISRSIIQNHGGKLWAVANEGPGMSVQFTIPKYQ
jgi:PAS domain S-box-containing protein